MTRTARQLVVWSVLVALVSGSILAAPRHREAATFDDVPPGTIGVAHQLDDVALSNDSGRMLARAKGPARSLGVTTFASRAASSTSRVSYVVARVARVRVDRTPLYDLHRAYRL